jgi:hypothetical protein
LLDHVVQMWKALNDSQYALRVEQKSETEDGIGTRSMTRGDLIEFGSSTNSKKSFMGSSTRLWDVAPEEIIEVLSFTSAKKIIKAYRVSFKFGNHHISLSQMKSK